MNETIKTLAPFMIRLGIPVPEDLGGLSVEQLEALVSLMARDPMHLDGMSLDELEELQENLYSERCEAENEEPNKGSEEYKQWEDKVDEMLTKIVVVEERIENMKKKESDAG